MSHEDPIFAVTHNKTGNLYTVLSSNIIDTSNAVGRDVIMILYRNAVGQLFVRERDEFWEKFTEV